MKTIHRFLIALFFLVPAILLLLSFTVFAEAQGEVVYISDGGTGDGSTPDSPLGNGEDYYTWSQTAYQSSAINLAIARLASNGRGGTIVVVGPVTILWGGQKESDAVNASDFYFSSTQQDSSVCISFTSAYGGVDYRRTNAAAIVLQKTKAQNLSLGMRCRTVWNNILFKINYTSDALVEATGSVFACGCNETIIGHGVDTEVFLAGAKIEPTSENANYFFNLAGGHRYINQSGSANLSVDSGHWQSISGGPIGFGTNKSYGHLNGSVTLSVGGTATVLEGVNGGSYNFAGCVAGNVLLSIRGGTIFGKVIAGGKGGFSGTASYVVFDVSGGDFSHCDEILPYGDAILYEAPVTTKLDCRKLQPSDAENVISLAVGNRVAPFDSVYSPVVFIKDGATGTGLTPDSPLAAENLSAGTKNLHYDSVLYQAAELLTKTDGVIVLVGEVRLDAGNTKGTDGASTKDMFLPDHPDTHLTVTSIWNGVDYGSTKGAKLILQTPAELISGGPMTIENLTICTMPNETQTAANRGIFGNGYRLTIGEGVKCVPLDVNGTAIASPASNLYPNIYGGHRYSNIETHDGFEVTVNSGTFYIASGASRGIVSSTTVYGRIIGETRITIGGTARIYSLYATSNITSSFQFGNAYVNIEGGTILSGIYMSKEGGFGGENCTSRLTVTGGTISSSVSLSARATLTNDGRTRYQPKAVILDITEAPSSVASTLASKASSFDYVYTPVKSVNNASLRQTASKTDYLAGESFDPSGLVANLTAYSRSFAAAYADDAPAFSFVPDLSAPLTVGVASVSAYYGTKLIAEIPVTVADGPTIVMEGAMIRLLSEKQSLKFVATIDNIDAGPVSEYGIIAIRQDCFTERSMDQVGAKKIACTRADTLYKNTNGLTFGAVIPEIPIEEYSVPYTAFAYLIFQSGGVERTLLSEPITRSVEEVARAAVVSGAESGSAVEKLNDHVLRAVDEGWTSSYNAAEVRARMTTVVDNLYTMANVTWVCQNDLNFAGDSSFTSSLQYKAGTTYKGIPYIAGANGYASYDQWISLYPNGATYTGATGWDTMLGNMCSSAVVRAWESVIPTRYNNVSRSAKERVEFIMVGQCVLPEKYDLSKQIVNSNVIADAATADAKAQRIYENYAQARLGDFLVSSWLSASGERLGHVRMIDSSHPAWNSDGTINGDSSYLWTYEQCSTMNPTLNTTWRMLWTYKFKNLCDTSLTSTSSLKYVAVRPTVNATSYYPTPTLLFKDRNTPENAAGGLKGTAYSNYYIFEARLTVTDKTTGNVVLSLTDYPYRKNTYDVGMMDPDGSFSQLAGGSYHYSFSIRYGSETSTLDFDFIK